jgi:Mn2+/Fe2+ NRAMP family transporter
VPSIHPTLSYLTLAIGLIGTTITPWEQFYIQAAVVDKGLGENDYKLEKIDVYVGSCVMAIISFFIIVATASTLHVHGQSAETVTDVAQSLRPLAGNFAEKLFAFGLLNASLMAAAVVPLSTSYSVSEAFGWERSVNRSPLEAPGFFGLFLLQLLFGAVAVLLPGIPLLLLLVIPNVVGGMLLPIILIFMLLLINDKKLMGAFVNDRKWNAIAIGTTVVVLSLSSAYLSILALQLFGISS